MFENKIMEALSRVHPAVPLIIYLPLVTYFLYLSISTYSVSFVNIFFLVVAGIFVWTFIEYVLHKYIFHFEATSEFGKKIHFIFHGVHHDYPSDSRRLVMPPSMSIPLAALFYFIFMYLVGEVYVLPFFSGFIIGYLFYDLTHYAIHHFNMHNKFWLEIKNHHMLHHYHDQDKGYGVSSPLWDLVFGSMFDKKSK